MKTIKNSISVKKNIPKNTNNIKIFLKITIDLFENLKNIINTPPKKTVSNRIGKYLNIKLNEKQIADIIISIKKTEDLLNRFLINDKKTKKIGGGYLSRFVKRKKRNFTAKQIDKQK